MMKMNLLEAFNSLNDKYQMAVTRNNDVAKEQALSYVSYASNQVQMSDGTKEHASSRCGDMHWQN